MSNLRCTGLHKSFDGVWALADVSLQFSSQGIVAIIGPNGAGKTTLFNALTGFIHVNSGRCLFGEQDITGLAPHRIAGLGIARTFQELRLVQQIPVLDNVLLARPHQRGESLLGALFRVGVRLQEDQNREECSRVLALVGLAQKATDLAGEISFGEQKLLSLACCLATDAKILLLDEPVAGLHPELAGQILELLRQLRSENRLIVFIEHDLAAVREIADRVIVMDEGKIIADGTPWKILERPDIMEAYVA